MRHPLYVAFVWHMHQPYYLDEESGEFILPWVRLHATKDYLHMVDVLEEYPAVHATFNLVPSLVEQLKSYIDGDVLDRAWKVSLQEQLSPDDKRFIDSLFFSISRDKFIRSYPRYWQLFRIREEAAGDLDLLSDAYWRDLIAWFNLAWIDPGWLQREPVLRALVAKGSHFEREDIATILVKQRELMAVTLAAYRRLQRRGQVELSVSPYYHPILPLLMDSNCASEPSPWLRLPKARFRWREDALEQLRRAIQYHEANFGRAPAGLWPSEGAVSQGLVGLLDRVPEIRWLATDETILARSLGTSIDRNGWGYVSDPRLLYQPYWVGSGKRRVAIVFRDHYISDRIGFTYKDMTGKQAAEDLMYRFACIHEAVKDDLEPHLLSIILDGENCWEHYEQNGETFLRSLYEMLSNQSRIRAVTVSEYLNEFSPRREISSLATGSWINGNLETWIGEEAQNRAWEYLQRARRALSEASRSGFVPPEKLEEARRCMMAAEGSDWFWWYYSHNISDQDELFDHLFRRYLAGVYRALDLPQPSWVDKPITSEHPKLTSRSSTGYVHPPMESADDSPLPWASAGYIEPRGSTGAMQQGSAMLKRLYFGYDQQALFIRLESHASLMGYLVHVYVSHLNGIPADSVDGEVRRDARLQGTAARPSRELAMRPEAGSMGLSVWQEETGWVGKEADMRLLVGDNVLEAAVPLDALGMGLGKTMGLSLVLFRDNLVVQRLPEKGEIVLALRRVGESIA